MANWILHTDLENFGKILGSSFQKKTVYSANFSRGVVKINHPPPLSLGSRREQKKSGYHPQSLKKMCVVLLCGLWPWLRILVNVFHKIFSHPDQLHLPTHTRIFWDERKLDPKFDCGKCFAPAPLWCDESCKWFASGARDSEIFRFIWLTFSDFVNSVFVDSRVQIMFRKWISFEKYNRWWKLYAPSFYEGFIWSWERISSSATSCNGHTGELAIDSY